MEKRWVFFAVVLFGIVLFSIVANSASDNGKVSLKVIDKLASQGSVKVIVDTKTNQLSAMGLQTNVKSYSVEINQSDLNQLIADRNVKDIYYDYPVYAFLQDSAPLINATATWQTQIGGINITGMGQTICIIDTGVNYSNSDLGGCFGEGCKVIGGYDFVNHDSNPMDDNGHGTHVAGIVAANGGIRGIAPDAKIISIKVLDSAGSGSLSDIVSGINWCVGNSSDYNISAISMSLGTRAPDLFNSYCDGEPGLSSLKNAIDAAIGKNISVIAASGNDGNTTAVSIPACIQNVTAVGSSTKSDGISSFSNRNAITHLFAPGSSINSTRLNSNDNCLGGDCSCLGNYMICSGTSMATPMVAAAFTLIRQYYYLGAGKILTPLEIQNALNSTGKKIDDSAGSGFNFSRIDIYSAIRSLDVFPPEVSFISPLNRVYHPQEIIVNITNSSDAVYVWWNNGSVGAKNLSYTSPVSLNLSNGNYTFYVYANDSKNNINSSSINFSIANPLINLSLISPSQNGNVSEGRFFNISVNASCFNADCGELNISASLNSSGDISLINTTIGATPFYTNESNPRNISLNRDESQIVVFYVNATGDAGDNYTFFVNVNTTFNMSISAIVSNINLSVQAYLCVGSWTCSGWSACSGERQTRTCTDENACGNESNKPSESQSCDDGGSPGGGGPSHFIPLVVKNVTKVTQINNTNIEQGGNNTNRTTNTPASQGNSKGYIIIFSIIVIGGVMIAYLIKKHG